MKILVAALVVVTIFSVSGRTISSDNKQQIETNDVNSVIENLDSVIEAKSDEYDVDIEDLLKRNDKYFKDLHIDEEDLLAKEGSGENPDLEDEEELKKFLEEEYEPEASKQSTSLVTAEWNYSTDIKEETANKLMEETEKHAEFTKEYHEKYFKDLNPDNYESEIIKRQVKELKILGQAALSPEDLKEYTNTINSMTGTFSNAKICPFKNQNCNLETDGLSLDPDLMQILVTSTDYDELKYIWSKFRESTGMNMKNDFKKYVELSNKMAKANGFADKGEMWKNAYETESFETVLEQLWTKVEPLYKELHTYVSRQLKKRYGDKLDTKDGLIPAHLFGNMWAQSWVNLAELAKPFPDASSADVTKAMIEKGYTVKKMFEMSDEFYKSLGLESNAMSYGEKAMIEKPKDRDVVCHASAWDFSDREDFRIKMCTKVEYEDFITVHHEMGHIQYFILYKDQPISMRTGANPGFHEAVGDTIALSVSTTTHLKAIGLIGEDYEDSEKADLNALMNMALERVAFLPFGYLIDKWRWDVFSGKVTEENWNSRWWEYRQNIQKVKAPEGRPAGAFDPGAKFHIGADSQYIAYFVAHILEFQLYRSLCITAGKYDPDNENSEPLHKCDYYKSEEAGKKLRAGLSLGASKHWKEALKEMTGEEEIKADAILEYFKPLHTFLKQKNKQDSLEDEEELTKFLVEEYEPEASKQTTSLVTAEWNYATDIKEETANKLMEETEKHAEFTKKYHEQYFKDLNLSNYESEIIKRQVKELKILGQAALSPEDLKEYTNTINSMTGTFSNAKICPFKNQNCNLETDGLSLDPDLMQILVTSTDYDELKYIWSKFRESTGMNMKNDFKKYVELSNKMAKANGFADKGEMWKNAYETESFETVLEQLWTKVEPLYKELHTYVSRQLKKRYGDKLDTKDGLIPAHLFGNMWAQSWVNLAELAKPFPDASSADVTKAMIEKGYTVKKMFEMSDEFYKSLGLESNAMSYGEKAMIEKPKDRDVVCHASAWDFSDREDFRIKMCTKVEYEDFITVHHEMGHIQYFILYKDQPISLRTGANPGFHEAVGDTIALSVSTTTHLKEIGLIGKDYEDSEEADLNALMNMALERVAFLPFGYLIDKWRWDVFSKKISEEEWNSRWWEYRQNIQKVKAPEGRPAEAFDPGAKFHIGADSQYIAYFVAHILEFQLYRSLCITAGKYDPNNENSEPLHKCDYYKSEEAGKKLRAGLSLGASKHWKEALKEMTGEEEIKADAILEYFKPLQTFLKQQNKESLKDEEELTKFLVVDYEPEASKQTTSLVAAEWNYATDIKEETANKLTEETEKHAEFSKEKHEEYFKDLNLDNYETEIIKRQVKNLQILGQAALSPEDLKEYTNTINSMTGTFSNAKICPYKNPTCNLETEGLSLDPDLMEILVTSTDYDELKYIWSKFREATGVNMKNDFKKYVELSNKMAVANGFADKGEMWKNAYETESFETVLEQLWTKVEPLYKELHTYVSRQLKKRYGDKLDTKDGLIPAHLFGNMWAQSWVNLAELAKPFPDASSADVTKAMIEKGYTVKQMFEMSDEFYESLGLESNEMSYGEKAMIEKPKDRDVVCHASAWDFSDGEDFRIKMCTKVEYEDFITVHHEMGHIQYYILYKDQPISMRTGANPGFHEAVGDTIALSVSTTTHLKAIGLIGEDYEDSEEADLNALMNMALERVAFLPFGYLIDKWRWDVFSGKVTEENWNSRWWEYRQNIQKVKAPEGRPAGAFDPGAKFHIGADSQYIAYFVAHILEFQLYRSLCITAGKYDPDNENSEPLHKCDYYKSEEAGKKLRAGLSLGASKHWKEALKEMTGEEEIKADAILEYFKPLQDFLQEQNKAVEEEEEGADQTVAIAVGSVVGVLCVCGIGFYLYKRFKN